MNTKNLGSTLYCDCNDLSVKSLSHGLANGSDEDLDYIKNAFLYVRDRIRFGADLWKVKASDTLKKGYGACYNKNLLFMAILRTNGIPCILKAHPMSKTFTEPCVGIAHISFSNPFYHCFTEVRYNNKWIHLDPTLDRDTYETFFKPADVDWGVDWNANGMDPLYTESILGKSIAISDIDKALKANMGSWFMFRHEPDILLKAWLWMGNSGMWKKIENREVNDEQLEERQPYSHTEKIQRS